MKTCRRGHEYSSDRSQCPICQAASTKKSHQRDRKKRSRESVLYFQKHKDKKAANGKLYYERHPEKFKQHKENFSKKNPLYSLWNGMISRCYREADFGYSNYGGRGITVCDEWRGHGGYKRFIADMPPRPSSRHTLDRKNNDLGYSKENCKWSSREEQGSNRRTTKLLTICGRTQTVKQWATETGTSRSGFNNRIKRGWSEEKLLQKVDCSKQTPLSRERLLERVALALYSAIGEMAYDGKDEVEAIMKEVGILPNTDGGEESDGTISEATA